MARINDSSLVRTEYAEPGRLATRFMPFREWHTPDLDSVLVQLAGKGNPARVLEVGCGEGAFSARMRDELGTRVTVMDQSAMMVGRAAGRGLDAVVGDAQRMPFPAETFDVVVANWSLYHLPDLDRGLAEVVRVLRPGGRLVAATMGDGMMDEVWGLVPDDGSTPQLGFSAENGAAVLTPWFEDVRRIDMPGLASFPDRAAVIDYIESTLTRAHLADALPDFDGPLQATTTNVAFVATKSSSAHDRG